MIDILGYLVYIINPLTIIMATTYSIEGAFRYEFKNKKATYITSAIMAAVTVILVEYALIVLKTDVQHFSASSNIIVDTLEKMY